MNFNTFNTKIFTLLLFIPFFSSNLFSCEDKKRKKEIEKMSSYKRRNTRNVHYLDDTFEESFFASHQLNFLNLKEIGMQHYQDDSYTHFYVLNDWGQPKGWCSAFHFTHQKKDFDHQDADFFYLLIEKSEIFFCNNVLHITPSPEKFFQVLVNLIENSDLRKPFKHIKILNQITTLLQKKNSYNFLKWYKTYLENFFNEKNMNRSAIIITVIDKEIQTRKDLATISNMLFHPNHGQSKEMKSVVDRNSMTDD